MLQMGCSILLLRSFSYSLSIIIYDEKKSCSFVARIIEFSQIIFAAKMCSSLVAMEIEFSKSYYICC